MADSTQQSASIPKPFQWSTKSTEAVTLVAEDLISDRQIADQLGINRSTLHRWKQHSDFAAAVDAAIDVLQAQSHKRGIARIDHRLRNANDRHRRMVALIEARAEEGGDAPGADTGLLVRTFKAVGGGPSAYTVEEWSVDTGLLREMRELEKQIAQDTGQWTDKRELTGKDGGAISVSIEAEAQAVADTLGVPVAVILAEAERLAKIEAGDDA